jgi:hypothetical protein
MDMHFDYTMASKALATAKLDSVGASNQAALKVTFHPTPLHFLTLQEMVDEMLRKHALPDRICKSYELPYMSPY